MEKAFADASNHKGASVRFSGQIFSETRESDDKVYFHLHQDVKNYSDSIGFEVPNSLGVSLSTGDFVTVSGYIVGDQTFESVFGGNLSTAMVYAVKIEVGSYSEIIAVATKTVEVGKSITQNEFMMTLDKIEFSDYDTRVFLSADNQNSNQVSFYKFGIVLVIEGKTYEVEGNPVADYEAIESDLPPQTQSKGIVTFPKMDPTDLGLMKLIVASPFAGDWDIEFTDFIFEFEE